MNAEEKFYRRVQTATGDSLRTLRRLGFQEISASLQDVDGSLGDRPCEMDQTPGAAPERDAECHRGFDLRLQEVAAGPSRIVRSTHRRASWTGTLLTRVALSPSTGNGDLRCCGCREVNSYCGVCAYGR